MTSISPQLSELFSVYAAHPTIINVRPVIPSSYPDYVSCVIAADMNVPFGRFPASSKIPDPAVTLPSCAQRLTH